MEMHCKAGLQFMNRPRRMELHQNLPKCIAGLLPGGCNAIHPDSILRLFEAYINVRDSAAKVLVAAFARMRASGRNPAFWRMRLQQNRATVI